MAPQVPLDVLGTAVGVLVYSLICLISGFFLLWLVWVHDERKSYVAMLGFFVTLHTLASVIQQIHTIARWRDIKLEQYKNTVANAGNPELNITGASTGLDLVLFYIQYYSYNVESLLVFFWAVELANSRWLVLRFSVAFCALSLFQIVVVNFLFLSDSNQITVGRQRISSQNNTP
ncbi:hypothetical protein VTG60DRAFT_281 [Thermothelomyces hinnuleus]